MPTKGWKGERPEDYRPRRVIPDREPTNYLLWTACGGAAAVLVCGFLIGLTTLSEWGTARVVAQMNMAAVQPLKQQ